MALEDALIEVTGSPLEGSAATMIEDSSKRNAIATLSTFVALMEMGKGEIHGFDMSRGEHGVGWTNMEAERFPFSVRLNLRLTEFPAFWVEADTLEARVAFAERMFLFWEAWHQRLVVDLDRARANGG